MHSPTRIGMLAAASLAAVSIPLLVAPPAQATAYRYWTYWHVANGSWQFAGTGPDGYRVVDGSVEGWHFAVSAGTRSAPPPRQVARSAFSTVCHGITKKDGSIRVALVLDFGTAADSPQGDTVPSQPLRGVCEVVDAGSNGLSVLTAAEVAVRPDGSGLICAFNGYPAVGCGEIVSDPVVPAKPPSRPTPQLSAEPSQGPSQDPSASPAGPSSAVPTSAATTSTPGPSGPSTPPTASPSPIPSADQSETAAAAVVNDSGSDPPLVAGIPVAATSPAAASSALPAAVGAVLIALIAGGAFWSRRRRAS